MATKKAKIAEVQEMTVEEKLRTLYNLQTVDTEIDKIKILRGELPLEVRDLEDEIAGLETRMKKLADDVKQLQADISKKKNDIKVSEGLIKKYNEQQQKVRNNREFDSLNKEIEFQKLEIQLSEKRIKEFTEKIVEKKSSISGSEQSLEERKSDLEHKHNELDKIISETKDKEEALKQESAALQKLIEPRLLIAYKKIRANVKNGLAVVTIERDACGGCHNKIPPQRQLDIRSRKKITVCEHCGRVLVDLEINDIVEQ